MGTSAEGNAGGSTARSWQRGATRRAILDAARLLAARQNSTDFSLNTVAKEAGYSTTTVFAYFQTKTELFNAIIADDLAAIARQMRDGFIATPQPAEAPAVEQIVEAEPVEPVDENPPAETASAEVVEAPAERPRSTVVAFPADAKPEERPMPRADAWLERRLRVFEKTLADHESRIAAAQTDSAKAVSVAEEATKIFGARLEASEKRASELSNDLTTRLSAAEKRLRENHGELRDRLLNISGRIDTLEAATHGTAAAVGYVAPAPEEEPQAPEEPQTSAAESAPVETPLKEAAETYLSAARRAAQTAAALAEMEKATKKKPSRNFWFNRATAVLAVCVAMMFIFGALIAFALGEQAGRSTPVRVILAPHRAMKLSLALPPGQLGALAAAGNPQAQLLIGLRYLKGRGVAVNQPEAAKWIRLAAAHYPVAQYWMGQITEYGEGVSPDAAVALRWYEAAAAQGNRDAMYNLGVAHAEGLGTQRDFTQSAHWFTEAAQFGVTNAQFNLAVLYERGEGVPQSLSDAYKWYAIAAASGDGESKQRADAIATQISKSALTTAEQFATSFKPGLLNRSANVLPGIGQIALAGAS